MSAFVSWGRGLWLTRWVTAPTTQPQALTATPCCLSQSWHFRGCKKPEILGQANVRLRLTPAAHSPPPPLFPKAVGLTFSSDCGTEAAVIETNFFSFHKQLRGSSLTSNLRVPVTWSGFICSYFWVCVHRCGLPPGIGYRNKEDARQCFSCCSGSPWERKKPPKPFQIFSKSVSLWAWSRWWFSLVDVHVSSFPFPAFFLYLLVLQFRLV